MKVKLRLKMCQACGEWSKDCIEYNGEILCPICLAYEEAHIEERLQADKELSEMFDRCNHETY